MSEQEQIELKPKPQAEAAAPAHGPAPEDAGTQALADALQSSFFIVKLVMIGLFVVFLGSGFFIVHEQERAIILRLGKPVGTKEKALLGAGPHWAFPRPIDEVVRIPISTQQQADSTVGWYTPEPGGSTQGPPIKGALNPARDGYSLTSDANIIHVRATVRYHVTDPVRFHFEFTDARQFLTNALNNALLYASARYTVDEALLNKVSAFKETVTSRASELIAQQQLGVEIEQLDVTAVAPGLLQARFSEVHQAGIKWDDVRNKAESYANETLSRARAQAESRINSAHSERARLVGMVAAEAKKFAELLPQYQANPDLFVRLRQTETLEKVMANAQEKVFVPSRGDGKAREFRLQLSREPQKPAAAPAQP